MTQRSRKTELLLWGGLVALALALRLYDLGARPFHHDESQDAYFSWVFYDHGDYHYQPILHGPLRFYLTALNYVLFGDSNFTARLAPALMGTIVVALPYLLRKRIGNLAAFSAALLLAIGPTFLYFSRFAREDIYISAINLGLIIAIFAYLERPRAWGPTAIGVLLALAFATKESTFITAGLLVVFFVAVLVIQAVAADSWRDAPLVKSISAVGWVPWVYGFAAFWLVFTILFTVFFTKPQGLPDGIYKGLEYWHGQQSVHRGNEPWYFYIAVLFGEEWPVLLLAVIGGIWSAFRRPSLLHVFLVYFSIVSLAAYSYASERFAWLALHPLLPMTLLAGIALQMLLQHRGMVASIGVALAAIAFGYAVYASVLVNALHRADPREWLVSTQSSEQVLDEANNVLALDKRVFAKTRQHVSITIDSGQGATYPYAWYFRHNSPGYIDMTTPGYTPATQVLIMTEQGRAALLPKLLAYKGHRFDFRVWWVRDWSKKFSPSAWWNWFVHRRTWNPTGGLPEWIYVRRDVADD